MTWNQGVIQFVHRSFDPSKGCSGGGACGPNTWHWDNVSIAPAMPFSLLRGDRRYVDATTPAQVNFHPRRRWGAPALHRPGQAHPIQRQRRYDLDERRGAGSGSARERSDDG